MLRKPGSLYIGQRSTTLLKVKKFLDAEAKVLRHEPGKGKHKVVLCIYWIDINKSNLINCIVSFIALSINISFFYSRGKWVHYGVIWEMVNSLALEVGKRISSSFLFLSISIYIYISIDICIYIFIDYPITKENILLPQEVLSPIDIKN